jgi:hypothetical protein
LKQSRNIRSSLRHRVNPNKEYPIVKTRERRITRGSQQDKKLSSDKAMYLARARKVNKKLLQAGQA